MATSSAYSKRSSSVKRLLQEVKELASLKPEGIYAEPLADNLHDWHFTVEGPKDSDFDGGIYHGRITLPSQYPFKPPDIMLLTPNGRFELNKKVCLTITGFHEESWQPAWGIRTALVGLSSFFTSEAKGAIGGLDTSSSEKKRLASLSRDWTCPTCQCKNSEILPTRAEDGKASEAPEAPEAAEEESKPQQKEAVEAEMVQAPSTVAQPSLQSSRLEAPSFPAQQTLEGQVSHSLHVESSRQSTREATHTAPASAANALSTPSRGTSRRASASRPAGHVSARQQQVEERHLQVVELLSRQLALTDPSGAGAVTASASASQSVAFAAPASRGGPSGRPGATTANAPAPMWLDAAIGCVLIALASLIFRKMM